MEKQSLSIEAKQILRRVSKSILKEPASFEMKFWFVKIGRIENRKVWLLADSTPVSTLAEHGLPRRFPPCGVAACIAGHMVLLEPAVAASAPVYGNFAREAERILGLAPEQSQRLFLKPLWPTKFQSMARPGTKRYAENAVRRINFFIATEGTDKRRASRQRGKRRSSVRSRSSRVARR